MENANLLIAFIAVTSAAVVIQAGILIAMYLSTRKTGAIVESMAAEVKERVLPTADLVKATLAELKPKIEVLVTNVADSSVMVRAQLERVDATLNDVIDRARLQVIRADELVGRTLDRVEQTTDMVPQNRHFAGAASFGDSSGSDGSGGVPDVGTAPEPRWHPRRARRNVHLARLRKRREGSAHALPFYLQRFHPTYSLTRRIICVPSSSFTLCFCDVSTESACEPSLRDTSDMPITP